MSLDPRSARAWAPHFLLGGGALALLLVAMVESLAGPVVPRIEGLFLDAAFRLRESVGLRPPVDPRIAPLRISRRSTEQLGRWPWPRSLHAELLDAHWESLALRGVVMDILFRGASDTREDAAFADFLGSRPEVALAVGVGMTRAPEDRLDLGEFLDARPTMARHLLHSGDPPPRTAPWVRRLSPPHVPILEAAGSLGHIRPWPDEDKVHRRFLPFVRVEDRVLPSLAMVAVCRALKLPLSHLGLEGSTLVMKPGGELEEERRYPLAPDGSLRINWVAPYGEAFPPVYAHDLAEPPTPELRARGEGKVWVMGVSTLAVDMGPTPLQTQEVPLMEVHLHAANTILTDRPLLPIGAWATLLVVALFLAVLLLAALRLPPLPGAMAGLVTLTAFPCLGFLAFLLADRVVPMARGALFLTGSTTGLLAYYLLVVERARARARDGFSRYFPAEVVERILDAPEGPQLGGRKAELTVLFSDIQGFTSTSEQVDPDVLGEFLAAYFERMVEVVFAHGGTVDKFMGDGLMAFWGDPVPVPDHADRALAAARAMQVAAAQIDQHWAERLGGPVRIRVGINTGRVTVGNMGGQRRMEYTVLGRSVNLAQRLESACLPGGVLLGAGTVTRLTERPSDLDRREVDAKGIDEPVVAYQVPALAELPVHAGG
jgi:adenylate cyclase